MAAQAGDPEAMDPRVCMKECSAVADYARYLPAYVTERYPAEAAAHRAQIFKLLDCEKALPTSSELSYGLRCLRSYEEQRYPVDVKLRVALSLALWRLFVHSDGDRSSGLPPYNYSLRTRLVEILRLWLLRTAEEHAVPVWSSRTQTEEEAEEFARLKTVLDVKIPVSRLIREIGASPRVDSGVTDGKRRSYATALMNLSNTMRMGGWLGESTGQWLMSEVASRIDGAFCYTMLYARLMVVLMPNVSVPQAVLDGVIWKCWSALPEGCVPKFDLMWFATLARYAELRWAGKVSAMLGDDAGKVAAAEEALKSKIPWLWNKICRTSAVPFVSPAANAMDGGKNQHLPELDRYVIPEEIEGVVMGSQSTWKDVARFIVYSLDPEPPTTDACADGPLVEQGNAWSLLILLLRRAHPFLTLSTANGEWLWHCVTLIQSTVMIYFDRICRERLMDCAAPAENRLTRKADERFVLMFMPILAHLVQLKGSYEQMVSLEALSRLSRIAAMYPPTCASDLSTGTVDPFAVSVQAMIFRATQTLMDPAQSDRHVGLLQLCASSLPSLVLQWPSALGGILPVTLWGIDPTDAPKTFISLTLLFSIFAKLPCLDANDWPASDLEEPVPLTAWPVPQGHKISFEDSVGGAMVSSTFPAFALDLLERVLDYVSRMSELAKGRGLAGPSAHFEAISLGLMHTLLAVVAAQVDAPTYKQMVEVVNNFLRMNLLSDKVKPMKLVVAAVARANAEVSVPLLLPPIVKKLLGPAGGANSKKMLPLHEYGNSESEAVWYLNALSCIVRRAGPHLLEHRSELEVVIRSALMDEREKIPKLGAKLLRRVLFSTTAVYVPSDFRGCGPAEWQRLMVARNSSKGDVSSSSWPLKWWGLNGPWWYKAGTSEQSVSWHVPSEAETIWATALCVGAATQIGKMLSPVPVTDPGAPELPGGMPEGSDWLEGIRLPDKKKTSHGVILAMKLTKAVLRGTNDMWADERTEEELAERMLPASPPHSQGDVGRAIFGWFNRVLMTSAEHLSAQEKAASENGNGSSAAASAAGSLDRVEVPKILAKVLHCIGELLGVVWATQPGSSSITPALGRGRADHLQQVMRRHATAVESLHSQSAWRELPRVFWVMRVVESLDHRRQARCGGHRFAGQRRAFLELLCRLSFGASFAVVRKQAMEVLSHAAKHHVGSRWPLVRDVVLPALAAETQAALKCSELRGEAAEKEQVRLNDSLSAIAAMLGGNVQGLVSNVWRRGPLDAARIIGALVEAIYATTKAAGAASDASTAGEKRCEVTATTVARLIFAIKYLIEQREIYCRPRRQDQEQRLAAADEEDAECDDVSEAEGARMSHGGGKEALEAVQQLLGICERPDCHWRAQVVATAAVLCIRNSLRACDYIPCGATEDLAREVWTRWTRWLLVCLDPKKPLGLQQLAVHGLMLVLKQRGASLKDAEVLSMDICDNAFFEKLLRALPPIHHTAVLDNGDSTGGDTLDHSHDVVVIATEPRIFRLWPRVWMRHSSKHFSVRNALFWQTYVVHLSRTVSNERLGEMLQNGAEYFADQPRAEADHHVAFCEFFAGALRALRRSDEAGCESRKTAWGALHAKLTSELQMASQERFEDWCDAFRFATQGFSRPMLRGGQALFGEAAATVLPDPGRCFMTPLLNFVVAGAEGDLRHDALSCSMAPMKYEGDEVSANAADAVKQGSSFDAFKRLRLLMALLVEPTTGSRLETDPAFCDQLVTALQPGLGHPYKQLREEVARALFLLLRAAKNDGCAGRRALRNGGGLGAAARRVETWLGEEAVRLTPVIREDNERVLGGGSESSSTPQESAKNGTRKEHVVQSSGLCYALLHTALARVAMHHLGEALPHCVAFLLAASTHGDFELRTLASHALSVCCAAAPPGPPHHCSQDEALRAAVSLEVRRLLSEEALSDKEREKMLSTAFRSLIMANFGLLACGGGAHGGSGGSTLLLHQFRALAEEALGHSKVEVRSAAKSVLASFMSLDTQEQLVAHVERYKAMAGPPPKRGAGDVRADASPETRRGVFGLSCALLSCADGGVPRWTGKVIQSLVPYGRPGMTEVVVKEVQGAITVFLKMQQASAQTWKQCEEKLTPAQLELLSAHKGKLSYFS